MQLALRPRVLRPFRLRFIRRARVAVIRFLRAALREESPSIDPFTTQKDRFGLSLRVIQ